MNRSGPTVPRWQLGRQLTFLRERSGKSLNDVARLLGCSLKTARRMERGEVGVSRGDLLVLLDTYQVDDEESRDGLLELQAAGRQRAWWSTLGTLPENNMITLLEFEWAATELRIFEPMVIPGLFQTEEYARAASDAVGLRWTKAGVERAVELRLARQRHLFGDGRPTIRVILDEAAVRRPIGGPDVHRRQLERLLAAVRDDLDILQVVPFSVGGYPGIPGPFTIFEFGEDVRDPVVYTEGRAGNQFLDDASTLRQCSLAFEHMRKIALNHDDSLELLATVMEDL